MLYHIVQGNANANNIKNAIAQGAALEGEVLVIEDAFSYGPLRKEGIPFGELRNQFWDSISNELQQKELFAFSDLEQLVALLSKIDIDSDEIWYWMGNGKDDLITYYFLLHYLKKYMQIFKVININGLPFLDNDLKLFYPKSFADLPLKEIIKARKLARLLSPSEWETDMEEWKVLTQLADAGNIRVFKGGKQIQSISIDDIQKQILNHLNLGSLKLNKLLSQLVINPEDRLHQLFFHFQIIQMLKEGILIQDQQLISKAVTL